ncbi:hypothetical protein [Carboxydothermus hydrogenoformans]|uniref:Uncharacterized protein n=1 Tax=Carboxydothermus hydrogenoformans (strain ATCC BAA-161 / DSM 6008 / Z-2901) TaxID=246194 RepID=Q3AD57_CARHZ|nr:hypothetical protein [Carboxydothermus hydrogenoformans]ABB13633.1 conserved hypothetical protein [Carboxydothermus hydrogenoformans Z-2901]
MVKALALFSGGLDSTLAIKLILEQGVEVEAVNFTSPFCRCLAKGQGCASTAKLAADLGIKLHVQNCGEEYLRIVENPPHGYGSALNPCIDCRIFKFKKAKKLMEEIGAKFMITGEVLGQRPNSQRRDAINLIDREAGIKGLVLRPLSALHFPPTIAEQEGYVSRDKLLAISGRSRKTQMELAASFGINDYPCPSGGCLLTKKEFAGKVQDLIRYNGKLTVEDIDRLKFGRHFRLSPTAKIIVGRNAQENELISYFKKPGEFLAKVEGFTGPTTLIQGNPTEDDFYLAAKVTARYADTPEASVSVRIWNDSVVKRVNVLKATDQELANYRIVFDKRRRP